MRCFDLFFIVCYTNSNKAPEENIVNIKEENKVGEILQFKKAVEPEVEEVKEIKEVINDRVKKEIDSIFMY